MTSVSKTTALAAPRSFKPILIHASLLYCRNENRLHYTLFDNAKYSQATDTIALTFYIVVQFRSEFSKPELPRMRLLSLTLCGVLLVFLFSECAGDDLAPVRLEPIRQIESAWVLGPPMRPSWRPP